MLFLALFFTIYSIFWDRNLQNSPFIIFARDNQLRTSLQIPCVATSSNIQLSLMNYTRIAVLQNQTNQSRSVVNPLYNYFA